MTVFLSPMREAAGFFLSAMEEHMSEQDTTTTDPVEAETPEVEAEGTAPEQETPDLGDAGKKAIKAERDARKALEQQLAEAREWRKQREQADMSDLERAQAQAQEAQEELTRLRLDSTRSKVALEKGVPADLLDFLGSGTEEEIAARADLLLSRLNAPTTPRPDHSQGAKPVEDLSVAERAARAEQSGDRAAAARLKAQQLGALATNQR